MDVQGGRGTSCTVRQVVDGWPEDVVVAREHVGASLPAPPRTVSGRLLVEKVNGAVTGRGR